MSTNIVVFSGNLAKDPELKFIPSGKAVTDLRVAINNSYGKGENRKKETVFVDVRVWDKQAENACEYLAKGSGVLVEGSLKEDTWEDKQTGKKRSRLYVLARAVQFLTPKGDRCAEAKPEAKNEALEEDFNAEEVPF